MKSRNGESRRFAFLGFKNAGDAEETVKYFNNSFIHTSRISVNLAKSFADPTVPIPMKEKLREKQRRLKEKEQILKKQQEEFEERNRSKKRKLNDKIDEEIAQNPKLKEFLEATKHSTKVRSWDDGVLGTGTKEEEQVSIAEESDEEYQDLTAESKVAGNVGNEKDEEVEESENDEVGDFDEEVKENKAKDENVSDMEWLQQRKRLIKDSEHEKKAKDSEKTKEEEEKPAESRPIIVEQELTPEEKTTKAIRETGRLFIRNILYTASEDDFKELFQVYGDLEEVHIAIDTRTHKSKGFVYVQFKEAEDAVRAYNLLDKQIFQGRLLHILPGQVKKSHRIDEFEMKNLPLKKQRELKKKFEASRATFSWNSLFLNENAVLEAVADKIGVDKRDLIDPESSSSGVKQALAEAHVIGDVRKYFESKNIDLTSFNQNEKDDKIILVKNFPFGTTLAEITDLFVSYGKLQRVLFPPIGTIAIVEFQDAPAARTAFAKLAYRRFKKNILYLEKGPKGLFTAASQDSVVQETRDEPATNVKDAKLSANDFLEPEAEETPAVEDKEDDFVGITTSVFVKNLNFKTTSQELTDIFKTSDGFIVAKISQKPDAKNPGKFLSMGFGFLEFKTKEQALACIKKNDGKVIDGHKIMLKISHRKNEARGADNPGKKEKKSTKIIVKNLPFEATRKDVFELFNSFGQLKSVRVPKKFNKSARGFAFVEFNLAKEAEHAIDALKGVHLLGRRLNIEYAQKDAENAEEEIAKMTDKMKRQKNLTEFAKAAKLNGKRRVELDDENEEGF